VLFTANDPFNPMNRRISIIVMYKNADAQAAKDDSVAVGKSEDVTREAIDAKGNQR
jgi:hypothetical protein